MRFRLIEDHRDVWPVRVMCDALSVSPSGFYAWRSQPESLRKIANRELLVDMISGGFMRSTAADMGHRVFMPSCVPRAKPSAASGSSG